MSPAPRRPLPSSGPSLASRRGVAVALWLAVSTLCTFAFAARLPAALGEAGALGVDFARPELLWLALSALFVPVGAIFSLTDMPRPQQFVQSALRMSILVILAVAVAGPRSRQDAPRGVQVIHIVDRSESVPDALIQAAARGAQATLAAAGDGDVRVDVVAFDGRAERLPWPPTQTGDDKSADPTVESMPRIARTPVSGRETDLDQALNVALALVDADRVPHLVVWTDGVETRGEAAAMAEPLKRLGVRMHTPQLPALEVPAELAVESLEVPAKLEANVPFALATYVRMTAPMRVRCAARSGDQQLPPVHQTLPAGRHRVELGRLRMRSGGSHEVHVECRPEVGADRFASNNQMVSRVVVEARPRVLYIEGARGQGTWLARALDDSFEVEVREADGLPRSAAELSSWQAVILSDVARVSPAGVPQVSDADMRNLHRYVEQGGGLLVIGGENSLGPGGYQGTYLDQKVLPVRMDIDSALEMPSIAMMLCIDQSGSMAQEGKIALAKEAARATAELLAAEDKIGVIAFSGRAFPVVRLQRAGNRFRIASGIARLSASGGTEILPALQQAYHGLSAVNARVKHVLLLSDGQAKRAGIDAQVQQMRRAGMTVSTIGVGAEVGRDLLEAIADRGGGRSYFTDRPENLPRIFVRETRQVTGESIVEKRLRARRVAGTGRVDLLRGVPIERAPVLLGYLPTRVKRGAEEILRTSDGKPLLVRWRLGLGKVTVWTSDLKNRWAHAWLDWPGYPVLVRQLVRDALQEKIGAQVEVQLSRERDRLRLAVDALNEDETWMAGMTATARLRLPDGTVRDLVLPEVAVGRYETTTAMDRFGPYDVEVSLRAGADRPVLASGRATTVLPYPDEYRVAEAGQTSLPELVAATGGQADSGPAAWLDTANAKQRSWRWLWPDLALISVLLLLIDVLLRRVRLGPAPAASWFGGKAG